MKADFRAASCYTRPCVVLVHCFSFLQAAGIKRTAHNASTRKRFIKASRCGSQIADNASTVRLCVRESVGLWSELH